MSTAIWLGLAYVLASWTYQAIHVASRMREHCEAVVEMPPSDDFPYPAPVVAFVCGGMAIARVVAAPASLPYAAWRRLRGGLKDGDVDGFPNPGDAP